ncbi:MAG: MliC family protein [Halieaceae bacterium]|jgi:membrane-bound inhibitor of C-type lysozyme|nr:MliC family protein [Halieaceae bacterium]
MVISKKTVGHALRSAAATAALAAAAMSSASGPEQSMAPVAVIYDCGEAGSAPVLATFQNDTDPPSVILVRGDEQAVAFRTRTASGSRYTGEGVDFWEHHGEATLEWFGTTLKCRVIADSE